MCALIHCSETTGSHVVQVTHLTAIMKVKPRISNEGVTRASHGTFQC